MDNVEIELVKNVDSRTGYSIIYPKNMDFDYDKLRESENKGNKGNILTDDDLVLEFELIT